MSAEGARLVETARALGPRLAERAPETEAARRLPPDLLKELRAAGLLPESAQPAAPPPNCPSPTAARAPSRS